MLFIICRLAWIAHTLISKYDLTPEHRSKEINTHTLIASPRNGFHMTHNCTSQPSLKQDYWSNIITGWMEGSNYVDLIHANFHNFLHVKLSWVFSNNSFEWTRFSFDRVNERLLIRGRQNHNLYSQDTYHFTTVMFHS